MPLELAGVLPIQGRTLRRRLLWAGLAVLGGAAIFLAVSLWLFPSPRFPTPTGSHRIGTRVYQLTDRSRPEPFTIKQGDHRQLVVQIWYPSAGGGRADAYISHDAVTGALARRLRLPAFLLHNLRNAKTHARVDATAASGRFPVLIFAPGLSGFRSASLFWIEEMTSRGYVVVGLDQPGTAAVTVRPDGSFVPVIYDMAKFDRLMPLAISTSSQRTPALNGVPLPGGIIPFLANDLSFVLDELETADRIDPLLAGHLDLTRAGSFGMSLGGYMSAQACAQDPRFRACLTADSGHTDKVRAGLDQPVMIITRDPRIMRQERARAGGWPEAEIAHTTQSQRDLFADNRGDAYFVTMNGMFHLNWTDAPIWSPLIRWIGLAGPIDPYRGFAQTNALTAAFFDRHLRGREAPLLLGSGTADAHLETRVGLQRQR